MICFSNPNFFNTDSIACAPETLAAINNPPLVWGSERIAWLPLDEFQHRPDLSRDYHVNANWALYCENYLEGFHIPFVHAGLNAAIDFSDYSTELFYPFSSLQLGVSKTGENCFELPESSVDYGKKIAAYYFWVFPNMMFNFYPWGLSINIVQPQAVNKTKVSFRIYVWKEELRSAGTEAMKHHISIVPGKIFSPSTGYENCIRISFGRPWDDDADYGLMMLGKIIKKMIG